MTNDVCCSFAWFSSQSALLPLSTMHFYDIWLHFTQDCKEYTLLENRKAQLQQNQWNLECEFSNHQKTLNNAQSVQKLSNMSQLKKSTEFCWVFLCQENETFLNFQLLWNMHGNFEGLRSITTFALPESTRRVNKRMREQKKMQPSKNLFFLQRTVEWFIGC